MSAHEGARSKKTRQQARVVAVGTIARGVQHPDGERVRPHWHHISPVVGDDARVGQVANRGSDLEPIARSEQWSGRAEHGRVVHERGSHLGDGGRCLARWRDGVSRQHATGKGRRDLRPLLPVIHRVPHASAELDAQGPVEGIRQQTGRAQLHSLHVIRLLQERWRSVVLDRRIPPIPAERRFELADQAPVPSTLLIQEAELERGVAQPIADLDGRANTTLPEHVAEQRSHRRPARTCRGIRRPNSDTAARRSRSPFVRSIRD